MNDFCSFELSKELKKAGLEQTTDFYWDENGEIVGKDKKTDTMFSAYTNDLLGILMPDFFYLKKRGKEITVKIEQVKQDDFYYIQFDSFFEYYNYVKSKNESNARAKALIVLLNSNLISSIELNKKLIDNSYQIKIESNKKFF